MRLTMPEPKITLYEDGFEENCKLGRKTTGDKLSELVERIDEPLVIALDGAWGSGKSFFLKCWVGQHLKRGRNTSQTVYFDAFEHDFLDDPLIALTGAISKRFEGEDSKPKALNAAKAAAAKLWRPGLRIGLSLATAGATEVAGAIVDAGLKEGSKELKKATADFWKKEDGKLAAMEDFKAALVDLTEPNKDGSPTRKIIIVIDELDRCRPDYALGLIETIKHFFAVPGVHFVLGVNLEELCNSVRARYGAEVNANNYLHKFYTVSLELSRANEIQGLASDYFTQVARELELPEKHGLAEPMATLLGHYWATTLSLRDVEKIGTNCVLASFFDSWSGFGTRFLICFMIVLKQQQRPAYHRLLTGNLGFEEACNFLNLPEIPPADTNTSIRTLVIWGVLAKCFGQSLAPSYLARLEASHIHFDMEDFDTKTFERLSSQYVDAFKLETISGP